MNLAGASCLHNPPISTRAGGSLPQAPPQVRGFAHGPGHSAALNGSYCTSPGLMWKGIKVGGTYRCFGSGGRVSRRTFLRQAQRRVGLPPQPLLDRYDFGPVVDGSVVPAHPFDPAAPDISRDVAVIVGGVKDEMAIYLAPDQPVWDRTLSEQEMKLRVGKVAGDATDRVVDTYRRLIPNANPAERLIATLTVPTSEFARGYWRSARPRRRAHRCGFIPSIGKLLSSGASSKLTTRSMFPSYSRRSTQLVRPTAVRQHTSLRAGYPQPGPPSRAPASRTTPGSPGGQTTR